MNSTLLLQGAAILSACCLQSAFKLRSPVEELYTGVKRSGGGAWPQWPLLAGGGRARGSGAQLCSAWRTTAVKCIQEWADDR